MKPDDTTSADRIDTLLAGHALGDLDPGEREELAALLRHTPALRQRLDEFQTTLELLPLALPATAAPPRRLRRRLVEGGEAPAVDRSRRHAELGAWLMPALMGLGLLGMGIQLQQTRHQLAQLQQRLEVPLALQAVNRRIPLRDLDPGGRAGGEVLVTGNRNHNMLVVDDLPPPPPNHTYRLWARVQGRLVGCVPFRPDAAGHVAMAIPTSPTTEASSVSVSLETDPAGQAPQGPIVLSSSL